MKKEKREEKEERVYTNINRPPKRNRQHQAQTNRRRSEKQQHYNNNTSPTKTTTAKKSTSGATSVIERYLAFGGRRQTMQHNNDNFVKGILEDWSPGDSRVSPRVGEYVDPSTEGLGAGYNEEREKRIHEGKIEKHGMQKAQPMFRYSLIFINFTFVVAAMLLIMAGIVARENSAVRLCAHCADLTNVSIVFGVLLWMFAMFGFNWIRQRSILFLLLYVAFLLLMSVALVGVIIAAGVFDTQIRDSLESEDNYDAFLRQWKTSVANNDTSICGIQQQYNCSGFLIGCCGPGCWNTSLPEPDWVAEICPNYCTLPPASYQCTESIFASVRRNMGGFLVISCFSMLLVLTGIVMAVLARKVNQLLEVSWQKESGEP